MSIRCCLDLGPTGQSSQSKRLAEAKKTAQLSRCGWPKASKLQTASPSKFDDTRQSKMALQRRMAGKDVASAPSNRFALVRPTKPATCRFDSHVGGFQALVAPNTEPDRIRRKGISRNRHRAGVSHGFRHLMPCRCCHSRLDHSP